MKKISKSKLKPKMLEYFRQVVQSGEELIVTDNGKPVLKIIPYIERSSESLNELKGSVVKFDDPTKPVGMDDWGIL